MNATCTTCTTCTTTFRNVDRNEDGSPDLPGQYCADPTCGAHLCPTCLEHHSFHCDGCGGHFCAQHATVIQDGTSRPLKCCAVCAADAVLADLEEREPECTCQQTGADLFDCRGCEVHDLRSAYNVKLRAYSAVQRYDDAMGGVA